MTQGNNKWWKRSVIYQIYPRSFCDSNGDGIGDLNGITSRLDYLKELGVDVLWLSPVYASPGVDNGYDIMDYQAIDPQFGTMEDFDRLLAEAHARGIRIVMDLVVNHTSDQHAWFRESRRDRTNPRRNFYIWRDPDENGDPPNRWGSSFGGSAWEFDETRGQYYLHLFAKEQPDLNWDEPAVRDAVYDMMTWWCEKGVDGFRMDVISLISKPEGLPDGPELASGFTADCCSCGPHLHEYLQEMNERVLSRYALVTVGECPGVGVDEAALVTDPERRELDMVFHFEHVSGSNLGDFRCGKWDRPAMTLPELRETLERWQFGLEGRGWNSLYLSNHDQPRCVSRFGSEHKAFRDVSAKMLATMMHFQKGTPYIYQGEELGMTNAHMTDIADYRDVETLQAYQILTEKEDPKQVMAWIQDVSRDNARTPMQWDATENAGFTSGNPWIDVNPDYREINAAAEREDPDSVWHYYQKLIHLRHTLSIISEGRYESLLPDHPQIYAYARVLGEERLLVFCNDSSESAEMSAELADALQCGAEVVIANYDTLPEEHLRPYEALVLSLGR